MKAKDKTLKRVSERDRQAFQGIAEAFALLKEYSGYVPERHRTRLAHIEADLLFNDPKPLNSPDMIRRIAPAILAHLDAQEEDDEADTPHEEGDDPALLAAEFRSHCLTLADAIICTIRHPNCPAYVYNALGDAIAEMSNHQHESGDDEAQMIHRVCERAAD